MDRIRNYCPMVGICPYEPVNIKSDSYFLIQPFDSEKNEREKAIEDALRRFYGPNREYELKKSDSKIYDYGSYCDICFKIKSSQFCIVDISGELYEIIDKKSGKKEKKVFLRPNVALELGMAYGFNKPALILSRKLNGKRQIPSDIKFVRYIDISLIDFYGWSGASQKLLDRLRESVPFRPIKESLDLDDKRLKKKIRNHFKLLLYLKERLPFLQRKNFIINQISYSNGRLVGMIKDAKELKENVCFNFYISDDEIEHLVGRLKVYHIQPTGLAQVEFYSVGRDEDYLNNVAQECYKGRIFVPGKHRLELITPEEVKKINLKEIRNIMGMI
ncbi:MAG: hypothetical protein KAT49_00325 [Methanomicrobia archaeon]|nr:hypothetical protein [Methanomicrobia archaeon]